MKSKIRRGAIEKESFSCYALDSRCLWVGVPLDGEVSAAWKSPESIGMRNSIISAMIADFCLSVVVADMAVVAIMVMLKSPL